MVNVSAALDALARGNLVALRDRLRGCSGLISNVLCMQIQPDRLTCMACAMLKVAQVNTRLEVCRFNVTAPMFS